MPTDSNGVYTLPVGYHVSVGDTVEPSQHNPIFEDIQAALTARLPVNGSKGMSGPLGLADGLVGAPSLRFTTALTTGLYKVTGGFGVTVAGVLQASLTTAGLVMNNGLALLDGGDTASATALTLGAGNIFNITGTTAVTSIVTKGVGTIAKLRFAGALTLTHDATNLINLTGANIVTRAGDWAQFEEYATGEWRMIGYQRADGTALIPSAPRGYIDGCTLVFNSGSLLDIHAGVCRDSTNAVDLICPALTAKDLSSVWVAGSSAGLRATGAIANQTYHIWAGRTAASATADYYAHSSATAATALAAWQAETGGSSYAYVRHIGSIIRSGGSILGFNQVGDLFSLTTAITDVAVASIGATTAQTGTLTVPLGIVLFARIGTMNTNTNAVWVSALDSTDQAPSGTTFQNVGSSTNQAGAWMEVKTNTSGQFRYRSSVSGAGFYAATMGWRHPRGRDA